MSKPSQATITLFESFIRHAKGMITALEAWLKAQKET